MEFDKKDWKKKFKNFLVDKEYKKDNGNLEIILKARGKHPDYIRIFYKEKRYLYFRYKKNLKLNKEEYHLSNEISFEIDLHNEIANLSVLNLPRVEISAKDIVDILEKENFEQLLWRIYFTKIFGAKVINVEIEKPNMFYLFDKGNMTLTFSNEYIFLNCGKKPLKRFEKYYGKTKTIFTGEKYIQIYKKKKQILENNELVKEIEEKKENDFGNAKIVLKSIRKPFSHIDNHIFYKVSEYPVEEMLREVKQNHIKFLLNKKKYFRSFN